MAGTPHRADSPPLVVEDLTVVLDGTPALEGITFSLHSGEQVALVGPNGAGKTTLLKTVAGLVKPTSGVVEVYGERPPSHICIAYLPQRPMVDWTFPVSVADVVMMGRVGRLGLFRQPGRADREAVEEALTTVGLASLAHRHIQQLSGGQQQRMFIARALAQEAQLLLLDEPMAGLDLTSQAEILALFPVFRQRGIPSLVAHHDLTMAAQHFDRIILLSGRIVAQGSPHEVLTAPHLTAAYGGHFHPLSDGTPGFGVSDSCCEGWPSAAGRRSHG